MEKVIRLLIAMIFIILPVLGLNGETNNTLSPLNTDYIIIKDVEPLSMIIEGEEVVFRITVEYELASYDQGEISVGFNSIRYNSYSLKTNNSVIIGRERNRRVIITSEVIKNWGNNKDFKVYVNLSKYPHEGSWAPLASDGKAIEIEYYDHDTLPESKIWAIALTGIMNELNNESFYTLNTDIKNEENKNSYKEMLRKYWNIKNREELLDTITHMENEGHASVLVDMQDMIREISVDNFSIFYILDQYHLSQKQYNYLKFTLTNLELLTNRSIIVWDWGRNISLCRWGYNCGYLTEDEAWTIIMYYAKKIQPIYKSWEDYGYDYYIGRIFWASGFGQELEYMEQTKRAYEKLISPEGYWNTLNWDINLDQ